MPPNPTKPTPPHTAGMSLRYPATRWQDATPTGSGIVGAMVYGNITAETILLNHDALYYPRAPVPVVDVSDKLPEVRRLVEAGQYREAAQVMPAAYRERTGLEEGSTSTPRDPYQPLGAIRFRSTTNGPFRAYGRGVEFDTGRAWVTWTDDDATHTRDVFASRITDTVHLRITATQPGVANACITLNQADDEQGGQQLTHTAMLPGEADLTTSVQTQPDERLIVYTGHYPNGNTFGAVAQVSAEGGKVAVSDESIEVSAADEIHLRVKMFVDEPADSAVPRLIAELIAELADDHDSYDAAFAAHADQHRELFNRIAFSIDDGSAGADDANENLLMAAYDGDVPTALIQRMFAFGRFLLVCSSRPGGWPANLQGLWNGDYAPAWNADVHTDENIQMNYWQALPGAMPETALPLFDYFERHLDDFRENARLVHGCRGIFIPIAMTTHGKEVPCSWSNWTAAAGWIAQHFFDYYLFTGDRQFLAERAVPWLTEVAHFYEDFLIDGDDGKLLITPSISPENRPANSNSLLSMNATMDIAICREVLGNLCTACEVLGIEAEGVARWQTMLDRLPAYEINDDGAIREWLHPAFGDNYHHRHQSHLYPVFPGFEISRESQPELFEACRVAVEKRLVIGLTSQTGWSMAHMANIYARLGEGDRALECLELLTRSSTGPNLLTYHNDWRGMGLSCYWGKMPPFQIDANFGFTAAVLEMLVYSKPGMISLLPALPSKWRSGRISGIACRGGVTVDLSWDIEPGEVRAELTSRSDTQVELFVPKWAKGATRGVINLKAGEPLTI